MLDPRRPSPLHVVTLVGFGLVGGGALLPWVGEMQVRVYVLGMQSGLERLWVRRLLVLAGVGALVAIVTASSVDRRSLYNWVLLVTGGATALLTVVTSPLTNSRPVAWGVYVTLVGCLFVSVGPAIDLVASRLADRSKATSPSRSE